MKYTILYIFLTSSVLITCKSKDFTPYNYSGKMIEFGTGGGFTGQVTKHHILDNGDVFKDRGSEDFIDRLGKLPKNETKLIFETYDHLKLTDLYIDKPGNKYHFVIIKENGNNHKLLWDANDKDLPRELNLFMYKLKLLLKSLGDSESQFLENK